MELKADRFTIDMMGSQSPLGNVLLNLIKYPIVKKPSYGVHFTHTAINYRIKQLMNPDHQLHITVFQKKAFYTSLVVPILMGTAEAERAPTMLSDHEVMVEPTSTMK